MKGETMSSTAGRSSRHLSSAQTSPLHHRRLTNTDRPTRNPMPGRVDASLPRGLWPSSSSSASAKSAAGAGTLADHLGNDRLIDLIERLNSSGRLPYEGDEENYSKENRRLGGSMRYTNRSWEFDHSDSTASARRSIGSSPTLPGVMSTQRRRTSSWDAYASTPTRWSLSPSPGRSVLPSEVCKKQQAGPSSGSRPSSPGKVRGKGGKVGGLVSLGLHLFNRKPSGSSPASPLVARGEAARDAAHELRMCSNRVLQWRYVNARAEKSNRCKSIRAEEMLLATWGRTRKVQSSVVQKRVQLEKGKLDLRLRKVLSLQMRLLEYWGNMEKQHSKGLSATANYLLAAVCKVPLVKGSKADKEATSALLRRAMDLLTIIRAVISFFSPMAQNAGLLVAELAEVLVTEKSLLEECCELMALLSTLQIQEWSLKCHIIQLKSPEPQRNRIWHKDNPEEKKREKNKKNGSGRRHDIF